jgi:hypothetical protein
VCKTTENDANPQSLLLNLVPQKKKKIEQEENKKAVRTKKRKSDH